MSHNDHNRHKHKFHERVEKLLVSGSDCVIFPLKSKHHPQSTGAKFTGKPDNCHPGCNILIPDSVYSEIVDLPRGLHGIKVSWNVNGSREISWHVIERLS